MSSVYVPCKAVKLKVSRDKSIEEGEGGEGREKGGGLTTYRMKMFKLMESKKGRCILRKVGVYL